MKLVRYGNPDHEKPGIIDAEGVVRDASSLIADIEPRTISEGSVAALAQTDIDALPAVGAPGPDLRLGPPIHRPGKIIGIGRNYAEHAREGGADVPAEPMIFMKATSAVCGPFDPIELPRHATSLDWEVELAVVISVRAKYVEEQDAMHHILGYTIINDVSERHFQKERSGQFTKGKSHDTFAPLGPWLTTADDISDPQQLRLWTDVDGDRHQDGTTADMVFHVRHLVSYLSNFMTLDPGDIIATGTPAGVAMGTNPPPFLRPGQTVRMGIEGLGEQQHTIVAAQ